MLVAGAAPSGGWRGGTVPYTAVCSPRSLPERRNTALKISPCSARHPAAGRRIPAKKKGCFPASKPTFPLALVRSRQGFASHWGPSRGSVSPRPPPHSQRYKGGPFVGSPCCSSRGSLLLSLLQPLKVRQVQAANNLLKPDVLSQSCHEEFQGAPALGGPAPRSLPFRRGGETRPGAAR